MIMIGVSKMDEKKIIRFSIYINLIEIIISVLMLGLWNVFSGSIYYISIDTIHLLDGAVNIYQTICVILFLASIYLYNKGKKKVEKLGTVMISSGVTLVLAWLLVTYGILTWILAGCSIYLISKEEAKNILRL